MLQMVQNPASIAHPASGDNDRAAFNGIDCLRLLNPGGEMKVFKMRHHLFIVTENDRLLIIEFGIVPVDPARFNRHGTVKINLPAVKPPLFIILAKR